MKVRFMQIVDYVVGVPLCFLLTCFRYFSSLFAHEKCQKTERLLFIELSEMGSAIIAYSALSRARDLVGEKNLYFLIFKKNRESVDLLEILPESNVICIREDSFPVFMFDSLRALLTIRGLKISAVIDCELFSRFTAILTFLSGATKKVGFCNYTSEGLYRGDLFTHKVLYNSHQHMRDNFLALIEALSANTDNLPLLKRNMSNLQLNLPRLKLSEEMSAAVAKKLRDSCSDFSVDMKIVVLNPDPGDAVPIRGWALDNFINLTRKLLDSYSDVMVVIMGLSSAKPYADKIVSAAGSNRCIDFTGKTTSLREVVALFELGKVLVSNDSGPAHISALTNIRSVVLFGPETPALYGPLSETANVLYAYLACSPCLSAANHRYTICRDNKCLQKISVSEVFDAVGSALLED